MSYDLLVFDPSAAPRERAAFKDWYGRQTQWQDGVDTNDPEIASAPLREWYREMVAAWPNMQDPDLTDEQIDDPHITGYTFGPSSIYLDFRWSVAEEAYEATRNAAARCDVGFYDVSGDEGDGEIYFPGEALRSPSGGAWRDVAAQFRDLENEQ